MVTYESRGVVDCNLSFIMIRVLAMAVANYKISKDLTTFENSSLFGL
jgi:hypothetical protein